ncbi:MAG: amidase [Actinomycetota bacterium]|jgi:amidase
MNEWILRLDEGPADGPRLAVKDAIDIAGTVSTAGCKALADRGVVAAKDAPVVANARAFGARIVGKTNLHELCFGTTGLNPTFGDPVNPKWPDLVPGGSSSGSAVAVANDEADVGYGTDTGGSVRLPAACCGIAGLKTTHGRISIDGVWPLAPSLDTIGPLARDVAGLVVGMKMLEPGFSVDGVAPETVVGRLATAPSVEVDPSFWAAVDDALRRGEMNVEPVELDGWDRCGRAFGGVIGYEAWQSDKELMDIPGGVNDYVGDRLRDCTAITKDVYDECRREMSSWRDELLALLDRVAVIALPTLAQPPVDIDEPFLPNPLVFPFNLAGVPALSIPLPGGPGTSLQLVARPGGEEVLLATAARIEGSLK